MYPNPVNSLEYIIIGEAGKHTLRVFDVKGALVSELCSMGH